ncbi:ribonuclease HII [Patescibacteria group bacterium]|nr:ribonuclease HII [Patescibacteria group bacterium]MBU4347056.1 ribonuclease HII [Patescibacteria group bacterium]MBU4455486.1 ribonuclease HII [Patescibacteria group bacterium]MCG2690494.1 ribonuclease HII [Candidatus Parcubacteria bacterium]
MLGLIEEQNLFNEGYGLIAGIDEAGRGPLAGPVVAACVIFKPGFKMEDLEFSELRLVNDSKKLNEKKREALFKVIKEECRGIGVGICDHKTIDRINILQATFLAMKKAIGALKEKPEFIMVDGKFLIPNCSYKQKAIIGGDKSVFSIAAASIIAKVTRDRIMRKMHEQYPDYGFDKHKGYGTKLHLACLKKYGPCEIHRRSFGPIRRVNSK